MVINEIKDQLFLPFKPEVWQHAFASWQVVMPLPSWSWYLKADFLKGLKSGGILTLWQVTDPSLGNFSFT